MSEAVTIRSLTYAYPPTRKEQSPRVALKNLDLTIRQGEMFCLLGPNGSGKSTLFKLLSTLLPAPEHTVNLFGSDLAKEPANARQAIGVVFQNSSLDKKLTVRENLLHQGHLYNLKGSYLRERIDEILRQVRLTDRANDIAEHLSGGMQRRVELAKGLLHKPRLLLLDEPSTGLDPGARIEFDNYLAELQKEEGVTILLTTHIMDEAERCDRLAILDQGTLVAEGSPHDLKREIGGDVITITTTETGKLREEIQRQFGGEPKIVNGVIHFERNNGHEVVPQLVQKFPDYIDAITCAKPKLEDVFIKKTGRVFSEND
jgi:ABC-2 type transport system ATP-binding protein